MHAWNKGWWLMFPLGMTTWMEERIVVFVAAVVAYIALSLALLKLAPGKFLKVRVQHAIMAGNQ